jgi:Lrp/AsnC family transcriptional regulator for asnA, asnC and gidA
MVTKLSPLDIDIIRCFHEDARAPLVQVARALEQPESTIRHRLARLVREGFIEFVAVSDPLKLGYPLWVNIGLHVELARIRDVAAALDPFPEVYFVGITSGAHEVFISAVFRSNEELFEFITDKLAAIPGILGSTTYHFLAVTKRRIGMLPPAMEAAEAEGGK